MLLFGSVIGSNADRANTSATAASSSGPISPVIAPPEVTDAVVGTSAATVPTTAAPPVTTSIPAPAPAPGLTVSQENALSAAANYLDFAAFSRSGLISQLEYEGYATEDATVAVDTLAPDWNEQAASSAQNYLEFTSFSRSGLVDQLVYEGFTPEQAEYGVSQTGL